MHSHHNHHGARKFCFSCFSRIPMMARKCPNCLTRQSLTTRFSFYFLFCFVLYLIFASNAFQKGWKAEGERYKHRFDPPISQTINTTEQVNSEPKVQVQSTPSYSQPSQETRDQKIHRLVGELLPNQK